MSFMISTPFYNLIKNIFHSPLYKFSHKSTYFQVIKPDEIEVIFKSNLHFMCIYTWRSEVYCHQGDTSQLLLIQRGLFSKTYECRWITTDDIAYDRAHLRISEKTFDTFLSRYAVLNWMRVRNSTPQFYTL